MTNMILVISNQNILCNLFNLLRRVLFVYLFYMHCLRQLLIHFLYIDVIYIWMVMIKLLNDYSHKICHKIYIMVTK